MVPVSFGLGSKFNETVRPHTLGLLYHLLNDHHSQYFSEYADSINHITLTKGAYALIDPHNYMRYK